MQRKLTLSKGAYLWHEGDEADNIAVVNKGRLAVKSGSGLVGLAISGTVLGEGAIASLMGGGARRTAAVVALEDDTEVVEHSGQRVKNMVDSGSPEVAHQILVTLMAQTCRNVLMVNADNTDSELISVTLKGLLKGLIESAGSVKPPGGWKEFAADFHFLYAMRTMSENIRSEFGGVASEESLQRAQDGAKKFFAEKHILPILEAYLAEERDKSKWLESFAR